MLKKLFSCELKPYEYYFEKTCKNDQIPTPINRFKVGNDENSQNLDTTSLKSGLPQNYWKNGYRRVIGEHIGLTGKLVLNVL